MTFTLPLEGQEPWDDALNLVLSQTANTWIPDDNGMTSWSHDPAAASGGVLLTNGTLYLSRLNLRQSVTIANAYFHITTAGITPTAGQNHLSVYRPDGTRAVTAGIDATVATNGTKTVALAPTVLAAGFVWVALLFNSLTAPTVLRGFASSTLPNTGLAASTLRYATNGAGLTASPASIVPGSNAATINTLWTAVGP